MESLIPTETPGPSRHQGAKRAAVTAAASHLGGPEEAQLLLYPSMVFGIKCRKALPLTGHVGTNSKC